jgi:hypothetical protein
MNVLMDGPAKRVLAAERQYDFVVGQLVSPLTSFAYLGFPFAVDNGCFSGFREKRFLAILDRQREARKDCLFVAAPDVVGSARRTLEVFDTWGPALEGWPVALVAQDGIEDLAIPWSDLAAIFVGGSTAWKMGPHAADVVRAARILGKHVHVGRVNTPRRYKHFCDLGANTCDGTGLSRYSWMLKRIAAAEYEDWPLFETCGGA